MIAFIEEVAGDVLCAALGTDSAPRHPVALRALSCIAVAPVVAGLVRIYVEDGIIWM